MAEGLVTMPVAGTVALEGFHDAVAASRARHVGGTLLFLVGGDRAPVAP